MAAVAVAVCVVLGLFRRVSVYMLDRTSWVVVLGGLSAFWAPFWRVLFLLAARTHAEQALSAEEGGQLGNASKEIEEIASSPRRHTRMVSLFP